MAEQDPNTMVHTHVDENGNVITHCHGGEGHTHAHPHTHTQTKASSTGWPARSAIWSRSSAW